MSRIGHWRASNHWTAAVIGIWERNGSSRRSTGSFDWRMKSKPADCNFPILCIQFHFQYISSWPWFRKNIRRAEKINFVHDVSVPVLRITDLLFAIYGPCLNCVNKKHIFKYEGHRKNEFSRAFKKKQNIIIWKVGSSWPGCCWSTRCPHCDITVEKHENDCLCMIQSWKTCWSGNCVHGGYQSNLHRNTKPNVWKQHCHFCSDIMMRETNTSTRSLRLMKHEEFTVEYGWWIYNCNKLLAPFLGGKFLWHWTTKIYNKLWQMF